MNDLLDDVGSNATPHSHRSIGWVKVYLAHLRDHTASTGGKENRIKTTKKKGFESWMPGAMGDGPLNIGTPTQSEGHRDPNQAHFYRSNGSRSWTLLRPHASTFAICDIHFNYHQDCGRGHKEAGKGGCCSQNESREDAKKKANDESGKAGTRLLYMWRW